jgi:hypothetical protein
MITLDCLPVPARRARRLSGRSAKKFFSISFLWQIFRQQHVYYGQTATDHYFLGGLWTAGYRALPETVRVRVKAGFTVANFGVYSGFQASVSFPPIIVKNLRIKRTI